MRCPCGARVQVKDMSRFDDATCPRCKDSLVWAQSETLRCRRCGSPLLGDEVVHNGKPNDTCCNCMMSVSQTRRVRRGNPFIHRAKCSKRAAGECEDDLGIGV